MFFVFFVTGRLFLCWWFKRLTCTAAGLQQNLDVLKLLRCLQTLDVLAGEKEKHFFSSLYTSLDVLQLLTCVTWRGSRTSSRPTVSRDEVREPCHVTGYTCPTRASFTYVYTILNIYIHIFIVCVNTHLIIQHIHRCTRRCTSIYMYIYSVCV